MGIYLSFMLVLLSAIASLLGPLPAQAQATTLFACVANSNGGVRMVTASTTCKSNETMTSWNAQGPAGASGPAGPAGAQGPAGPPGPAGKLVACRNGNETPAESGGHFVDCGDGTVLDLFTRLMWEKKVNCPPTVQPPRAAAHCVASLSYSWSAHTDGQAGNTMNATVNGPDGTLFTEFLGVLNGQLLDSGEISDPSCHSGYCDWRIPTIGELTSIGEISCAGPGGVVCTHPAFGPVWEYFTWSATTRTANRSAAWFFDFRVLNGAISGPGGGAKSGGFGASARAVRGGN